MTVTVNKTPVALPDDTRLCDAVRLCSPFAEDPVVVLHNGASVASDATDALREGDALAIYPLLIGG